MSRTIDVATIPEIRMERLDDLMLFAEVVQRMGFAAAARSLGMQRSKLSRRVAELEERMGVRLLQRNTRRVSLTPAGERIYGHARTLVNEARAGWNRSLTFEQMVDQFAQETALKRISTVEEVAAVAVLLASDVAAGITGAAYNVDGGTAAY